LQTETVKPNMNETPWPADSTICLENCHQWLFLMLRLKRIVAVLEELHNDDGRTALQTLEAHMQDVVRVINARTGNGETSEQIYERVLDIAKGVRQ